MTIWRSALANVFGWGAVLVPLGLLLTAGFLFREALDKATILPFTVPLGGVVATFALLAFLNSWSEGRWLRILHESRRLAWRLDFSGIPGGRRRDSECDSYCGSSSSSD